MFSTTLGEISTFSFSWFLNICLSFTYLLWPTLELHRWRQSWILGHKTICENTYPFLIIPGCFSLIFPALLPNFITLSLMGHFMWLFSCGNWLCWEPLCLHLSAGQMVMFWFLQRDVITLFSFVGLYVWKEEVYHNSRNLIFIKD